MDPYKVTPASPLAGDIAFLRLSTPGRANDVLPGPSYPLSLCDYFDVTMVLLPRRYNLPAAPRKSIDINVARQFSSWPFGTLQMSGITTITSITMPNFMDIMRAIKSLPGWLLIPLLYLPFPSNITPTHPLRFSGLCPVSLSPSPPPELYFLSSVRPSLGCSLTSLFFLGYSINAGVRKGTFRNHYIGSGILLPPARKLPSLVFQ